MTTRRDCLALAATAWALSPRLIAAQQTGPLITRPIPSSGERLPIIGLGSSATFSQAAGRDDTGAVRGVLAKMIELGGRVFDTAPGYGASEQLAGQIVKEIDTKHEIFWATKLNAAGWGGRTADRFPLPPSGFPMITALSGGIFTRGANSSPLSISPAPTALNQVLVLNGFGTTAEETARRNAFDSLRALDGESTLVSATSRTTQQAVDIGRLLNSDVSLGTVFPNTTLGNQLKQVAKVIKFNAATPALGLTRQIFFCQLGGFDTHQNQVATQASLLQQVSQAVAAFYQSTVELGMDQQVTTFTLSDFGRTLQPAGTGSGVVGSDHAWGSHHFVVGGAVRGGDFFGVPGPNGSVFPVLQLNGPSDTDNRGRWIPTASVEQYAATLASWYGVGPADIPVVFPNIGRFPVSDLGFMI